MTEPPGGPGAVLRPDAARERIQRLLDAAELVHAGEQVSWADLAAQLGYSDQAHLIRDFTAAVGTSPARYAKTVTGPSDTA